MVADSGCTSGSRNAESNLRDSGIQYFCHTQLTFRRDIVAPLPSRKAFSTFFRPPAIMQVVSTFSRGALWLLFTSPGYASPCHKKIKLGPARIARWEVILSVQPPRLSWVTRISARVSASAGHGVCQLIRVQKMSLCGRNRRLGSPKTQPADRRSMDRPPGVNRSLVGT